MSVEVVTTRTVPFSPVRPVISTVFFASSLPSQICASSSMVPSFQLLARKSSSSLHRAALSGSSFRKAKA